MGETRMGNRAFGVFRSNFHGQERGLTNEPPPDSSLYFMGNYDVCSFWLPNRLRSADLDGILIVQK